MENFKHWWDNRQMLPASVSICYINLTQTTVKLDYRGWTQGRRGKRGREAGRMKGQSLPQHHHCGGEARSNVFFHTVPELFTVKTSSMTLLGTNKALFSFNKQSLDFPHIMLNNEVGAQDTADDISLPQVRGLFAGQILVCGQPDAFTEGPTVCAAGQIGIWRQRLNIKHQPSTGKPRSLHPSRSPL